MFKNSSFLSSISWFEKTHCGVAKRIFWKGNILNHISGCAECTYRLFSSDCRDLLSLTTPQYSVDQRRSRLHTQTEAALMLQHEYLPFSSFNIFVCFWRRLTSSLLEKPKQRSANVATIWICVRMRGAAAQCAMCAYCATTRRWGGGWGVGWGQPPAGWEFCALKTLGSENVDLINY